MDAMEFTKSQVDLAGYKLEKAYEGASEQVIDLKICSEAMSPREIAAHLAECYQCVITEAPGGKFEWNSFSPSTTDWPALFDEMMALRELAVNACLKEGGESGAERAANYIVDHDNYHVGQLCLARLQANPDWDPLSIYQM